MPDNSHRQRHVGLAVAYNAWSYYQATGDIEFLAEHGAELLVEVARLFASLATHDPDDDRFDISGVMGPDEYHDAYPGADAPGLRNNAYTNVLAAWVCWRTLDAVALLAGGCGCASTTASSASSRAMTSWWSSTGTATAPATATSDGSTSS
jgi:trehalose/maltose hydrolase-like predicted phosphorylase